MAEKGNPKSCYNCWYKANGYWTFCCRASDRKDGICKDWVSRDGKSRTDALEREWYGVRHLYGFETHIGKDAYTLAHSLQEAHDKLKDFGVRVRGKERYKVAVDPDKVPRIWRECLRDGWCYG